MPSKAFAFFILLLCLICSTNAQYNTPQFKVIAFYTAKEDQAHISYVHEANRFFPKIAKQYNFIYDSTNDWSNLNEAFLSKYQVVLFLENVHGFRWRQGNMQFQMKSMDASFTPP